MDQSVMNFAGTAARGSAIGTAVSEGMVSYLADSNDVEVYTGAAWSPVAFESYVDGKPVAGLVPIIAPTVNFSGGTATANTLGTVSFTSVTSISLNNVFTSAYANYKILVKTSASAQINLHIRLRASGTDNATNDYFRAGTYVQTNGGTSVDVQSAANFLIFTNVSTGSNDAAVSFDIFSPQQTKTTHFIGIGAGWSGAGTNIGSWFGAKHQLTNSYDGFSLIPSSGNITGTVQVLGYNI